MTTLIVFGGGAQIEVPLDVEQVRDALEQEGQGRRLSEFDLTEPDRSGRPVRVFLNRDQVAFIVDADTPDKRRRRIDVSREPVVDLWGNPITPRRRKR